MIGRISNACLGPNRVATWVNAGTTAAALLCAPLSQPLAAGPIERGAKVKAKIGESLRLGFSGSIIYRRTYNLTAQFVLQNDLKAIENFCHEMTKLYQYSYSSRNVVCRFAAAWKVKRSTKLYYTFNMDIDQESDPEYGERGPAGTTVWTDETNGLLCGKYYIHEIISLSGNTFPIIVGHRLRDGTIDIGYDGHCWNK